MTDKQIPERIFKIAEGYDGIPLDYNETDDELVLVLTDGRKIIMEKESATKKRIQRAEADQAEQHAADALAAHEAAIKAERSAFEALTKAQERAEKLRAIADGEAKEPETKPKDKPEAKPKKKGNK